MVAQTQNLNVMDILLRKLVRFFPYESIHASCAVIEIEDKDSEWYKAISLLLKRYEADKYVGCSEGYFNVGMDNKITLELHPDCSPQRPSNENIYLTYWDNKVSISTAYHLVSGKGMHCTTKLKKS